MKSPSQSKKNSAVFAAPTAHPVAPGDWLFAALLALAVLLRLWLALRGHAIRHPDEIFQGLEQAHRLVFGYGVPTIEADRHLRWPGLAALLAVPQYLAALLQQGPALYMPLTRTGAALLSLLPVPLLYLALRSRVAGTIAALACLLPMFWVELVDFATSPLADALATPVLCAAALLPLATARRDWLWAIGFCGLLALACALRLQLAVPALLIAVPVLWQADGAARRRIVVAALAMLIALAAIDLAAGLVPFADVVANFSANLVEGLADNFGTEPWYYYPLAIAVHWGPALPVGIALLVVGLRQSWRLSVPGLALLLALSLIAHKEYRFYLPATELLVFAMGWGAAAIAGEVERRAGRFWTTTAVIVPALLCGMLVSPAYLEALNQSEDNIAQAEMAAAAHPDLCGLAVTAGGNIYEGAGYTYLHRNVPLAWMRGADLAAQSRRYNFAIAPQAAQIAAPYARDACFAATGSAPVCLYVRPGGCAPA
jgi:hypothetical protein